MVDEGRVHWTAEIVAEIAAEEGLDLHGVIVGPIATSHPAQRADIVKMLRTAVAIPEDDGRP